jgi:hypothetical protein
MSHPEVVSRRQIAWAEGEVAFRSFWVRVVAQPPRIVWAIGTWMLYAATAV